MRHRPVSAAAAAVRLALMCTATAATSTLAQPLLWTLPTARLPRPAAITDATALCRAEVYAKCLALVCRFLSLLHSLLRAPAGTGLFVC